MSVTAAEVTDEEIPAYKRRRQEAGTVRSLEGYLTVEEAADKSGYSPGLIRRMLLKREQFPNDLRYLAGIKLSGTKSAPWHIHVDELARWMAVPRPNGRPSSPPPVVLRPKGRPGRPRKAKKGAAEPETS